MAEKRAKTGSGEVVNLILCGGVGSRLWPLSRKLLPKQFARILQGQTLFERTVQRNLAVASSVMIAANRHQAFLAFNQMENLGISEHFGLIEPIGRNTAPAMALAAMLVEPETIMLVTPSDHLISKDEEYAGAVKTAVELAAAGRIVTFGIEPDYPETGFGYIEAGSPGADAGDGSPDGSAADPYAVRGFREKPDAETAVGYLEAGNYYWNSGMFCFRADVFLSELKHHAHDVYEASFNAFNNANGLDARRSREPWQPMVEAMHAIPAISVDYAVMEKSDRIAVVPCDIGWSDLGSLDALYDYYMEGAAGDGDAEAGGNASAADTEPVYVDANRNLVIGEHRQVALIDVDELMVVETPDALLIAKKGSGQKVKEVVEELQGRPGPESRLTERFPNHRTTMGKLHHPVHGGPLHGPAPGDQGWTAHQPAAASQAGRALDHRGRSGPGADREEQKALLSRPGGGDPHGRLPPAGKPRSRYAGAGGDPDGRGSGGGRGPNGGSPQRAPRTRRVRCGAGRGRLPVAAVNA
jgi:mannose-1-phosphate guanylyltransferase